MAWLRVRTADGVIRTALRWDIPSHDPATEFVVQVPDMIDAKTHRWDVVVSAVRPETSQERAVREAPALAMANEQTSARALTLPTFAEIDTLVDTVFPGMSAPQRAYLTRLSKLVRVLAVKAGL